MKYSVHITTGDSIGLSIYEKHEKVSDKLMSRASEHSWAKGTYAKEDIRKGISEVRDALKETIIAHRKSLTKQLNQLESFDEIFESLEK